jgi:hypothetical protein
LVLSTAALVIGRSSGISLSKVYVPIFSPDVRQRTNPDGSSNSMSAKPYERYGAPSRWG